MSRFRLDRGSVLHASVEADRVAMVKLGRRGEVLEQICVAIALDPGQPTSALQSLSLLLSAAPWRGATRRVVVSDRLVRYLVLPRPLGLRSLAELQLAVTDHLAQAFDLDGGQWRILIDAPAFTPRVVACALPLALLEALEATFAQGGPCLSIRPYLVAESARLASRLPARGWFASATRDYLAILGVRQGGPRSIRILPGAYGDARIIAATVARERLLQGDDEEPGDGQTLFSGWLTHEAGDAPLTRLDLAEWESQSRAWSHGYRMALAGVWP